MNTTIRQICEATGLSSRTVSRILRRPDDSPHTVETRQRVLGAAQQLGYRPNAAARAARTGRFNAIAMLLGRQQEKTYLRPGLLDGVYDVLERHDLHLTIARMPDSSLTDETVVPRMLREWMADGMLINYVYGIPPRMVELIERYALPSIWINDARDADCVYAANELAGFEATQRLLELGHRHIVYVELDLPQGTDLTRQHYAAANRWSGYVRAMAARPLTPRHWGADPQEPAALSDGLEQAGWTERVIRLLQSPDHPTALVAATERESAAILLAAATLGLRVPEDLSVITFAGGLSIVSGRAVDSMALDRRAWGAEAARMLLEKIEQPTLKLPPRVMPFTYRPGGSIGPPRQGSWDAANHSFSRFLKEER
jgi:LacI family transcriptional regulator